MSFATNHRVYYQIRGQALVADNVNEGSESAIKLSISMLYISILITNGTDCWNTHVGSSIGTPQQPPLHDALRLLSDESVSTARRQLPGIVSFDQRTLRVEIQVDA
jgi:hypothetical protein